MVSIFYKSDTLTVSKVITLCFSPVWMVDMSKFVEHDYIVVGTVNPVNIDCYVCYFATVYVSCGLASYFVAISVMAKVLDYHWRSIVSYYWGTYD